MEYQFKTDREEQWSKYKENSSIRRKPLKTLEKYFYSGEIDSTNGFSVGQILFLHPEQTISSWNKIIQTVYTFNLKEWQTYVEPEEVSVSRYFEHLQRSFLNYITDYNFHPKDRAHIFTLIFGPSYDKNREFPIRLRREARHRKINIAKEFLLSCLLREAIRYLEKNEDSYVLYILPFIKSLVDNNALAGLTLTPKSRKEDREGRTLNIYLKSLLLIIQGQLEPSFFKEQHIGLAQQIISFIEDTTGDVGEYGELKVHVIKHPDSILGEVFEYGLFKDQNPQEEEFNFSIYFKGKPEINDLLWEMLAEMRNGESKNLLEMFNRVVDITEYKPILDSGRTKYNKMWESIGDEASKIEIWEIYENNDTCEMNFMVRESMVHKFSKLFLEWVALLPVTNIKIDEVDTAD